MHEELESSSLVAGGITPREELAAHLNQQYAAMLSDTISQRWFDRSGFANFGYWPGATDCARDAGNNLVDKLVGMMPAAARPGTVLDVACNAGGTTARLAGYFGAANVTAIDIGAAQLALAAQRVPDASFLRMNAVQLEFEDATFDRVFCVEAAHHFHTRAGFLKQAFRVLKPGGYLVLADVLFALGVSVGRDLRYALLKRTLPAGGRDYAAENVVANLEVYRELLTLAGFELIVIEDALELTWKAYRRRHRAFLLREAARTPRLARVVISRLQVLALWDCTIYAYPLLVARKMA